MIAEYAAASTAAAEAVAQLTAAAAAEVPVLQEQAAAASASAAATNVLGLSSRQSATAGIGILEGRMMSGNRAAAAFLSTTLGLGPVLQAAFPIIGALALGEVLIDIGKNAYEAYQKFVSLSAVWDKLTDDVLKMQQQDFINVHSIETATERLNQANDAAVNLRQTAEEIHKLAIGQAVQGILSGNLGQIALAAGELSGAHGTAEASAESTKQSIALQAKVLEQQHQLTDLRIEAAHSADAALGPEQKITAEYAKRIALAKEEEQYTRTRDRLLGNPAPANAGGEKFQLEASAAGGEAYAQRVELNRKATAQFVDESIAEYKRMEAESARITEAITANWLEGQKADAEGLKRQEENDRRAAEEFRRNRAEEQEDARSVAQTEIQAANETFTAAEREIAMKERVGLVSHRVATEMLLDAERLKEQATEGALKKESLVYDPVEGGRELQQFTAIENRMTQEAQKAAAERQKITQQETQQFIQQWQRAAQDFNRDFTQAFNSVLTKQDSAEKAFGRMFGQIELQLIDFVAQWILKQAEMWAMNKVLQATGLATQQATQKTAAVVTVANDAGVAAAGTMAYYSAINPIIAPAMASVAFQETMAFAAFERGGVVMGSGGAPIPILAHAGERVLSAAQTQNFESMVNTGGSRSATLNQENHFGGGVTQDMLEAHTASTMSQLRAMIRPEAWRS